MDLISIASIVISVIGGIAFLDWVRGLARKNREMQEKLFLSSVEAVGSRIIEKMDDRLILTPKPVVDPPTNSNEASLFFSVFTERELQIGALLVTGATNKEVADKLGTATSTVNNQVENMRRKCAAKNKAGLVSYLLEHELV